MEHKTKFCTLPIIIIAKFSFLKGDLSISGGMTLTVDSDLNGPSPQFTLTCISTGGPPTTVIWTRDSATAVGENRTILVNAETATYTHTLTVIGRTGGLYRCNVSNNKPSSAAAELSVIGTLPHSGSCMAILIVHFYPYLSKYIHHHIHRRTCK